MTTNASEKILRGDRVIARNDLFGYYYTGRNSFFTQKNFKQEFTKRIICSKRSYKQSFGLKACQYKI